MESLTVCGSMRAMPGFGGASPLRQILRNSPRHVASGSLLVRAVSMETKPATGSRARREQNVSGEFFVDRKCIDCDTCRWMAPEVFSAVDGQSAVYHQPATPDERLAALQALLSCPTASIHTVTPPKDIREAQNSFPIPVDPHNVPGIYDCGYHSERSFGATSYFITRPDGNILVDSPRYNEKLAQRLDELGGVRYMFLTHIDDVADHKKWQSRFNCERILHSKEVDPGTVDVETKLEGEGPWYIGSDVKLIFTPGHSQGHVVLLKDKKALFTGDHLDASADGELSFSKLYNSYSVQVQVDSIERLIHEDFVWVLPGHWRRHKFQNVEEKNRTLADFVAKERAYSVAEH